MLSRVTKSTGVIVAILAAAFFVIAAQRLRTFDQVPNRDVLLYGVIGHELLNGRQLYSDLWDHKPPLIYVSYAFAETLVGFGEQQLYLLAVVLACWTAAAIAWCGARVGAASAAWALSLWVLTWNSASLEGNQPNAELFMNALLITAFGVVVTASQLTRQRAVVFGALVALVTLFKPYGLIYALLPLVLLTDRQWMIKRNLLAIPVAIAAVWIPVVWYFVLTNRTAIFVETLWGFNRRYAGSTPLNLVGSVLLSLTPLAYIVLVPLIAIVAIVGWSQVRRGGLDPRPWRLLLAYIAITHVAVALPGRFFAHYYQLWLPPLIVGAAWSVTTFRRPVLLMVGSVCLLGLQIHDLRLDPDEWGRRANVLPESALEARRLGAELRRTAECEFGLNIGSEVGIYFYGHFRPAAGVFYQSHVDNSQLGGELLERIRHSDRYRPCFLTVGTQTTAGNEQLKQVVPELTSSLGLKRNETLSDPLFDVYVRRSESAVMMHRGMVQYASLGDR